MQLDPRVKYTEEIYKLIDKHYKNLPKKANGDFDEFQDGFHNNDVDALRHAYVSGRFTQKYGAKVANILGILNEIVPVIGGRSSPGGTKEENMDLWNNAVGRKYGKKTKTEKELFDKLMKALKKGDLIIDPNDSREYDGDKFSELDRENRIIVLEESKTGENLMFFDLDRGQIMSKAEFASLIGDGKYPNYEIRYINGKDTPVSKKDGNVSNNLC